MSDLLQLYRQPKNEKRDKEIQIKVHGLSKFLPEPMKAQEFLKKLSVQLGTDNVLLNSFEKVVDPDVSCKECQLYVVSNFKLASLAAEEYAHKILKVFNGKNSNDISILESNSKENGLANHDQFILRYCKTNSRKSVECHDR